MPLFPGQLVNQRYRIDAPVEAQETTLYRAHDLNLDLPVAILEQVPPDNLIRLNHANLPRVIDNFTLGAVDYLVVAWLEGDSLATVLSEQGVMSQEQAVWWLAQLCDALLYLGDVFPTLDPAHILIDAEGRPVLVGFAALNYLTPTADTSRGYIAPEQYSSGSASEASLIYTLGTILYHLLTGQAPPDSMRLASGQAVLTPPSDLNHHLTPAVDRVVLQAMALNPAERFQSLAVLRWRLLSLQYAPPDESVAAPVRQGWPLWAILLGMLAFVAVGAAGVLFGEVIIPPEPTATAVVIIQESTAESSPTAAEPAPTLTAAATVTQTTAITATATLTALEVITATLATPMPSPTPFEIVLFDDPVTGAPMVFVPEGPFIMGGESGSEDAQLAHEVFLDAFYIDQYEVTNAQYAACVEAGACEAPVDDASYTRERYFGTEDYVDYPVVQVSWEQAAAFCGWREARLPTEAEWEKAARSTDERTYPWGEALDCTVANFWSATGGACVGDTVAVGSYEQGGSPFGAFDMAGNVWEWVSDWYAADYYANSPRENPPGPDNGGTRVLRGGSWVSNELNSRATFRNNLNPQSTSSNVGFRCALTP